jgi:HPt (histidine-containing phosphotransfer) domain-containing protein
VADRAGYAPAGGQGPLADSSALPAGLYGLAGYNPEDGLARCGGKPQRYISVLEAFLEDSLDYLRYAESREGADPKDMLGLLKGNVHALKSALGTIGASALSGEAASLEAAAGRGDSGPVRDGSLAAFDFALLELRTHIVFALGMPASDGRDGRPGAAGESAADPFRGRAGAPEDGGVRPGDGENDPSPVPYAVALGIQYDVGEAGGLAGMTRADLEALRDAVSHEMAVDADRIIDRLSAQNIGPARDLLDRLSYLVMVSDFPGAAKILDGIYGQAKGK